MGDLTEQQLQAIINKGFAGGLSKKYLSNMCTDLTMFCKWLRLSKMSTLRPEELHVPKGARSKEKEILQPEDLRTLFEVDTTILDGKLIEDPYVNAYRFSVVTGLRPARKPAARTTTLCAPLHSPIVRPLFCRHRKS